jgi:hypothetical protein
MLKPFFKDSSAPRTNFLESDVDRLVSSYVDACIKENGFYSLPSDSIDEWCADALLQRPGETRMWMRTLCFRLFFSEAMLSCLHVQVFNAPPRLARL